MHIEIEFELEEDEEIEVKIVEEDTIGNPIIIMAMDGLI
jgi:hypothetical protein